MTGKDDTSLSENEMDEIADRVVDRLTDDAGTTDRLSGDDRNEGENGDDEAASDDTSPSVTVVRSAERDQDSERDGESDDGAATRRTPSLGETIERSVEETMTAVEADIERALDSIPSGDSVVFDPADSDRKSVYKTQLQKGGRIAVPDPEIEALGLDPGDTLQVVIYPVGRH